MRGELELTATIGDSCEFDTETCRTWLSDLRLLKIVGRKAASHNAHSWRLLENAIQDIQTAQIWPQEHSPPDTAPHAQTPVAATVGCKVGGGAYELLSPIDNVERAEREAIQELEAENESESDDGLSTTGR